MRRSFLATAAAVFFASTLGALAQSWPTQPIKIIVGFPPGGVADAIPRLMQDHLSKELGQPVVVENKAGGAGVIAMTAIAEGDPNHTLGIQTVQNLIYPSIARSALPYDAKTALRGIAMIATQTSLIAVHPDVPAQSLGEFIVYAKTKPGELNFGTAGIGHPAHIMMETLNLKAGISLTHVPYKGINEAYADLVAGRLQIMLAPYGSMKPHLENLRPLAVSSEERFSITPDLPTMAEASGFADFILRDWYAFVAPAKMDDEVAQKLNTALNNFMQGPEFTAFAAQRGLTVLDTPTPADAQTYLMTEMDRWAVLSSAAKVQVD